MNLLKPVLDFSEYEKINDLKDQFFPAINIQKGWLEVGISSLRDLKKVVKKIAKISPNFPFSLVSYSENSLKFLGKSNVTLIFSLGFSAVEAKTAFILKDFYDLLMILPTKVKDFEIRLDIENNLKIWLCSRSSQKMSKLFFLFSLLPKVISLDLTDLKEMKYGSIHLKIPPEKDLLELVLKIMEEVKDERFFRKS